MNYAKNIKLYVNDVAPMVQPVMITLLEKKVDFNIEYVDLHHKPEWFYSLSPTLKLPILEVDGTILFESAAINEYLDETFAPRLIPKDPVIRAQNRAWTAFALTILMDQHVIMTVRRSEEYEVGLKTMRANYAKVEAALDDGPYFNGEDISLVDFTYAPILLRQDVLDRHYNTNVLSHFEKISAWTKLLLERPSVKDSILVEPPETFEKKYLATVLDSYLSNKIGGGLILP